MIIAITQLIELANRGFIQVFGLLFLFGWLFWLLKAHIRRGYRRYRDAIDFPYSVILRTDGADKAEIKTALENIKQYAKAVEIKQADESNYADVVAKLKQVDVVIVSYVDAVWDDTTLNILKSFDDVEVGAAVGREVAADSGKNPIKRFAAWQLDSENNTRVFQGALDSVIVESARLVAVQKDLLQELSAKGKDLTIGIARKKLDTVYQSDAAVTVKLSGNVGVLLKQYLKNFQAEYKILIFGFFKALGYLHPYVWMDLVQKLLSPLVYMSIVISLVFVFAFRLLPALNYTLYSLLIKDIWTLLALVFAGFLVGGYLRQLFHFKKNKRDIKFLPLYVLAATAIMPLLKVAALFSFGFSSRWIGKVGGVLVALSLFVMILPIATYIDTKNLEMPLEEMTNGRASLDYYAMRAKKYAGSKANQPILDESIRRYAEIKGIPINPKRYDIALGCYPDRANFRELTPEQSGKVIEDCLKI